MRVTTAQLLVFALLYAAYALSLVVKRNYAFWKEEAAAEGLASAAALGSLGALYESASGAAKVGGAVLVDYDDMEVADPVQSAGELVGLLEARGAKFVGEEAGARPAVVEALRRLW